jgi:hypothetical protein
MEAIIVNVIVVAMLVLFAVMAIGPMLIDLQASPRKHGKVVQFPARRPQGPSGDKWAA